MVLILKMTQNGQAFKIYDAGNTAFLLQLLKHNGLNVQVNCETTIL